MTAKKTPSCIFLKLGTIFLKSKNVERHFSWNFKDFQIFFLYFRQIKYF